VPELVDSEPVGYGRLRMTALGMVDAVRSALILRVRGLHIEDPAAQNNGRDRDAELGVGATAAAILEAVWESIAEILGTAATATLIRRAAERGASRTPNLRNIEISRNNLVRYYRVPDSWRDPREPNAAEEVETLLSELRPILIKLTGQVVVRRIDAATAELGSEEPPADR
jgi:hypothetical protein